MVRSAPVALVVTALLLGVATGPAAGAEQPTGPEARAIAKAVKHGSGVRPAWVAAEDPLISSSSRSWAIARQVETEAGDGRFQPKAVMLLRPQGSRRWVVVAVATKFVGCGIAPNEVVEDLTGDECPQGRRVKPVPE